MAYEMKEGEITLFINDKTSDNQPDMKGKAMVKGEILDVAVWRRESANGTIRHSGTIKVKEPYKKTEQRSEPPVTDDGLGLPF